jgi:ubiquinone/menaquinone biosynthesis C-methylase UbiE
MSSGEPTYGGPFDSDAASFERRAGLPKTAQLAAANALFAASGGGRILDVGAGTGDIGLELVRLGANYLGIDASGEMLEIFRARAAGAGVSPALVLADARSRWPVEGASVSVIFGSRSLHLLDVPHVTQEARRVASVTGARVVVGRVVREADSPRALIRREMRHRLSASGVVPRPGGENAAGLLAAFTADGATPLGEEVVAEWTVTRTPRASLDDWEGKPGLAGVSVEASLKRRVLSDLRAFVEARFGDIDAPYASVERYSLAGVELAPTSGPPRTPDTGGDRTIHEK